MLTKMFSGQAPSPDIKPGRYLDEQVFRLADADRLALEHFS
jgi:hypothetical protein